MVSLKLAFRLAIFVCALGLAESSVTVYYAPGQNPQSVGSAAAAAYTGAAAYNPTTLTPPPVPTALNKNFPIQLVQGGVPGSSIQIPGHFFGFSMEMSVVDQIREFSFIGGVLSHSHHISLVGKNSCVLYSRCVRPSLNLMSPVVLFSRSLFST